MGHLGAVFRQGDQARIRQQLEQASYLGCGLRGGRQLGERGAAAGVLGAFAQLGQAQEDAPRQELLVGRSGG